MEQEQQHTGTVAHGPPAADRMMQAIVQDAYGTAGVLRLVRISLPEIAASACPGVTAKASFTVPGAVA